MIRHSWKITAVAAVVAVVFSSQAASAVTNHKLLVNTFQPNACTATTFSKFDLATVRASLQHFDQRELSKFGLR